MSQPLNTWEFGFEFWIYNSSLGPFLLWGVLLPGPVYFNPLWHVIEFSWHTLHLVTSPNTAITTTPQRRLHSNLGQEKIICISFLLTHNQRGTYLRVWPFLCCACFFHSCASKIREFSCLHLRWESDKSWLMAASNRIWRSDPSLAQAPTFPSRKMNPTSENQSHKV